MEKKKKVMRDEPTKKVYFLFNRVVVCIDTIDEKNTMINIHWTLFLVKVKMNEKVYLQDVKN